jgi:hypothetical protein
MRGGSIDYPPVVNLRNDLALRTSTAPPGGNAIRTFPASACDTFWRQRNTHVPSKRLRHFPFCVRRRDPSQPPTLADVFVLRCRTLSGIRQSDLKATGLCTSCRPNRVAHTGRDTVRFEVRRCLANCNQFRTESRRNWKQPGLRALQRWIQSMDRGSPNIAERSDSASLGLCDFEQLQILVSHLLCEMDCARR